VGATLLSAPLSAQTGTQSLVHSAARFTSIPSYSDEEAARRAGWIAPLASSVVPGSGQLISGAPRGAIYLVAEIFLISMYANSRGEANREQDRYIDLAFEVARSAFAPSQRDTAFEYFEQMSEFVESGPFDTDPGPGFAPPTDERTFNGSQWRLARETFFVDPDSPPDPSSPEYQQAIEFYRSRAIGPNFTWSWLNAPLEHDAFKQAIRESDDAFQRSTVQLGLVLANHLLSTVDALISERLSAGGRRMQLRTLLMQRAGALGGPEVRWTVSIEF
jgi:hypothetical protein